MVELANKSAALLVSLKVCIALNPWKLARSRLIDSQVWWLVHGVFESDRREILMHPFILANLRPASTPCISWRVIAIRVEPPFTAPMGLPFSSLKIAPNPAPSSLEDPSVLTATSPLSGLGQARASWFVDVKTVDPLQLAERALFSLLSSIVMLIEAILRRTSATILWYKHSADMNVRVKILRLRSPQMC